MKFLIISGVFDDFKSSNLFKIIINFHSKNLSTHMAEKNMSAESKETERRLTGLALMLKEVYIPSMESKKEISHHM